LDEAGTQSRLAEFLEDAGLGAARETLSPSHRRERSDVWTALLTTRAGDARLQLFVYNLVADPAGIVDAEEERVALTELARIQSHDLVPRLVASAQTDTLAILAAASVADAEILHRYLEHGDVDIERRFTYQPQLDRLFGADVVEDAEGRRVATWLMSVRRAQLLAAVLEALAAAANPSVDDPPFPLALAAYYADQQAATEITSFGEIPAEYSELAWLQAVVPRGEPLGVHPVLPPGASPERLAARVFTTLAHGHGLPATFSRRAGCCWRGEMVTAEGALVDAYFLTAGEEVAPGQLPDRQLLDLANALQMVTEAISDPAALEPALLTAVTSYAGTDGTARLNATVADAAARTAGQPLTGAIPEPLAVLASALLRARP
jgi:hypothetical protein